MPFSCRSICAVRLASSSWSPDIATSGRLLVACGALPHGFPLPMVGLGMSSGAACFLASSAPVCKGKPRLRARDKTFRITAKVAGRNDLPAMLPLFALPPPFNPPPQQNRTELNRTGFNSPTENAGSVLRTTLLVSVPAFGSVSVRGELKRGEIRNFYGTLSACSRRFAEIRRCDQNVRKPAGSFYGKCARVYLSLMLFRAFDSSHDCSWERGNSIRLPIRTWGIARRLTSNRK
jgi:hypothetical protein